MEKIRAIIKHKGYRLYTRPYELNIVGLRSKSTVPNRFDDEIHVFYKTHAYHWEYHVFKATTDPGTFWLRNPIQPQGTAILADGQYEDAYELGLHKGEYLALVQRKPVTIFRDYNRDAVLDFLNGKKYTGYFGIDIHRANKTGDTKTVDKNSAGCQVFENAEEFYFFLTLCEKHRKLYGNSFTYSLIDFRAVRRENFRRVFIGSGITTLLGIGYLAVKDREIFKSTIGKISDLFHS
jgi:hypothetical protein